MLRGDYEFFAVPPEEGGIKGRIEIGWVELRLIR